MKLETFADLMREPETVDCLVDGMIPRAARIAMYGPPKSGKTFLAADLMHAVCTGRKWLGRTTVPRQRRALYVLAEGRGGMPGRVRAWADARGFEDVPGALYLREPLRLHDTNVRAELYAALAAVGVLALDLLVIDTLSANAPPGFNENETAHMKQIIDAVEDLGSRLSCATCLVHHTGNDQSKPRGATDLVGRVDGLLRVERAGEHGARLTLEFPRDLPPLDPIDVVLRRVGTSLVPEVSARREGDLTPSQLTMLKALAQSDGPLKAKDWEARTSTAHSSFHRARGDLVMRKLVEYTARLGYAITPAGRQAILALVSVPRQSHEVPRDSVRTVPQSHPPKGGDWDRDRDHERNGTGSYEDDERSGLALEGLR